MDRILQVIASNCRASVDSCAHYFDHTIVSVLLKTFACQMSFFRLEVVTLKLWYK